MEGTQQADGGNEGGSITADITGKALSRFKKAVTVMQSMQRMRAVKHSPVQLALERYRKRREDREMECVARKALEAEEVRKEEELRQRRILMEQRQEGQQEQQKQGFAATIIQTRHRGREGRKRSVNEREARDEAHAAQAAGAATAIQAGHRGREARREVEQTRALVASENATDCNQHAGLPNLRIATNIDGGAFSGAHSKTGSSDSIDKYHLQGPVYQLLKDQYDDDTTVLTYTGDSGLCTPKSQAADRQALTPPLYADRPAAAEQPDGVRAAERVVAGVVVVKQKSKAKACLIC
jgi:hypothetical protein